MARSNSNLASVDEGDAPFGLKPDGTPRKRAAREGKRTRKPIRVVFSVTDVSGNPVEGARVEYHFAGTDNDAYIDACDANPTASRGKIVLTGKNDEQSA